MAKNKIKKYKKTAKFSKSRDNRKRNKTNKAKKTESEEDDKYSYPYYLEDEKSSDSKENKSSQDSEEEEEEKEEQILDIQNNIVLAQSSYDDNFLNQNDFTNKEIVKYKESLIHDEDEVQDRLWRIYRKKGELKVLMIAEKPRIALLISQALSKGKFQTESWEGLRSHHFDNLDFKGFEANFTVCSVYGNVYEYGFDPTEYRYEIDPVDTLTNRPIYLYRVRDKNENFETNEHSANLQHLEEYLNYYLNEADVLIFWMDWDKVGENIWLQVTEYIKNCISGFPLENIFRAEFFSLSHKDIWKSYMNLKMKIDESKSSGVYARMEIDLRVGVSYSELIRSRLSRLFNKYNEKGDWVSYGPWQFPTLWFCYERMKEIEQFESEDYWTPVVEILFAEQKIHLNYKDWKMESEVEAK